MSFYNEMNRRPLISRLAVIAMLIGLGGLSACDMIGIPGSSDGAGEARMEVRLVDNPFPFDLVDEVNVTITHVDLRSDDETVTVMNETRTFNLLELQNGVYAELGDIEIPADHYTQARVHVENASVLMLDGRVFDMKVPSGVVKVNLDDVVVEEGQNVALTLDFDVSKSFVVQGNPLTPAGIKGFLLKPTIISKGMKDNGRGDDDDDEDGFDDDDDDGFDDGDFVGDVHIIRGIVSEIVTVEGSTFLNVSDLQILVVPGETEFEGFTEIDALVSGESYVKVAYVEDSETGLLVAKEVEIEDPNEDDGDDDGDDIEGDDDGEGDGVEGDNDGTDDSDDVEGDDNADDNN